MRLGRYCSEKGLSARDGLARAAEAEHAAQRSVGRRAFLGGVAAGAAALVAPGSARAVPKPSSSARIAILGGGLAGLACADRLRARGYAATIYEANPTRLGGRCYSNRKLPGQVGENGGEMIDNQHKVMLAYAQEFNLLREDLGKAPGEPAYRFFGQSYSDEEVVDEIRVLVDRMRPDLQRLSGAPDFYLHSDADAELDGTSMEEYLATRAADLPLAREVLRQAYIAEYGRELDEQSTLNLLLFFHLDRRSRFNPFAKSDERFHLVGGNDGVVQGIAARLPGPIVLGARVNRLRRNASGEYAIRFAGSATEVLADTVVVAMPFSVLRTVELDPSLGLSADKVRAIDELGYGYNAKTLYGFTSRPWWDLHGSNGLAYADLPNVQNTWETNYTQAVGHAVLTDYAGGARGYALQVVGSGAYCGSCHTGAPTAKVIHDELIQQQADAFLTDLDLVYPGAKAAATVQGGKYLVSRAHWLPQSYSRGSYTCYLPGQFTSIAGLEGEAAGALKFAGEHANSFYEYQGFMEGACISGIDAADAILDDIKNGLL
ncbi:MAG: FAD-dependent oxidoreductase [Byssovorax sp.]